MNYFEEAQKLAQEIAGMAVSNGQELEAFRIRFLGSKNILKNLFAEIKNVPAQQKGEYGQLVNSIKQSAEARFEELQSQMGGAVATKARLDLSAPAEAQNIGSRHPVSLVMNEIVDIFNRLGFQVAENREIEDEWHNFSALNTPEDHPSRDMQDTYYLQNANGWLLRSQTSTAQVRIMGEQEPPIRVLNPGRVYRNETISARAHCQFHQVEGLYIDKQVSFADLKQTLMHFANEMFGHGTKIRMRPSFFPFTEPSTEVDVSCFLCNAQGCNVCKHTGWVEILGAGMVDPNVLKNSKIDPEKFSGFAFGMGVERIAMLRYRINDIRLLFENDYRFLSQFKNL